MLMWVFGVSYLAICILFLATFLANIDAGDAAEWKLAISLELFSEFVLVPSVAAFFLLFTTKLTSKWTEAVREAAERVGSSVAGEIDRPRTPTAARVRLKAAMNELEAFAISAKQSGELQGSPTPAKVKLKAIVLSGLVDCLKKCLAAAFYQFGHRCPVSRRQRSRLH
jgi:hypothetical protein